MKSTLKTDLNKVSALFSPAQLALARKARGHTKAGLAEQIKVTPTSVAFYESGASKPNPATVAKIAETLKFPIDFFSREAEAFDDKNESIQPFFRSLRKTSQIERERAIAKARLIYRLSQSFEQFVDFPKTNIPELHVSEETDSDTIETIADKVRTRWKLGDEPIPHMIRLLESHGILVVRQVLNNTDMSAFSYRFPMRPMVLLGDDIADAARSRFNAAHELGHLVMHAGDRIATPTVEKQAHMFASAFLMPKKRFLETFPRRLNWSNLGEMKRFWKTSMAAILYRARELESLSDASYRRIIVRMSGMGWRADEPMRLPSIEEPIIFKKAVESLQDDADLLKTVIDRVRVPDDLLKGLFDSRVSKRSLSLK